MTDKREGTCPNQKCGARVPLNAEGYIAYHSWPYPTRQVCPGSGYSSVEDVKAAQPAKESDE